MARDLRNTRAADRLGRFGEGLVANILMRRGYEIAFVDDAGVDLIASKEGKRFTISVKTRLFREESQESRILVIEVAHLEKLGVFVDRYGLQTLFAHVACLANGCRIHTFVLPVDFIKSLRRVKYGYSLRFHKREDVALVTRARAGIAYLWVEVLGRPGRALAPALGVHPSAVPKAARRRALAAAEWRSGLSHIQES